VAKTKILEQHPHPKFPRLVLDLRNNSRFYQARTFLDGKLVQKSTKTTQLPTAFKLAEDWYRRLLRASVSFGMAHPIDKLTSDPTVAEVFSSYRAQLKGKERAYADQKWSPVAEFWRALQVREVSTQTFRDFYAWRRRKQISNHTLHKDVVLVRQVLRYAMDDPIKAISELPSVPKIGKIDKNPRPWLTQSEWRTLLRTSETRIREVARNARLRKQRQDTHDLMLFLVHSMCRVGEVLSLRFRDCRLEKNSDGDKMLLCEVSGKRGMRTVVALIGAASVYERRLKQAKDTDALIFPEHHRDAFRELLEAAGLRRDTKSGFERNFKSLRATAISFRILNNPDLNLQIIARNAGTSVVMIDEFYAKRLTAEMNKDALSAIPRRKAKKSKGNAANAGVVSAAGGTQ
jgi:integrase